MTPLVTLLTDFGTRDPYVGALSGALLGICPEARLVTITHEIPAHDILQAGVTLAGAAPYFPCGTIHLAVVDPGVGTARRGLVLAAARQVYVGPDNGLFTPILDREPKAQCFAIENRALFRAEVHPTFHGRDIFAPVAGHLAHGLDPAEAGPAIDDPQRAYPNPASRLGDDLIEATVIGVDVFGNVTTSLTRVELERLAPALGAQRLGLVDAGRPLPWHRTYGEATAGQPFLLWGSSGYLELALREDSAGASLGLRPGQRLTLRVY